MPGTFSPPPLASDPDMHHGTCVTHVPWCMLGSLTSGFLWSRWRGKRSRRMRNPQFYVSGKRPIVNTVLFVRARVSAAMVMTCSSRDIPVSEPGPRFNIKMSSYQYRESHCGDKTVVRSSYLYNGIPHTGKMTSLYWIMPQKFLAFQIWFEVFVIIWVWFSPKVSNSVHILWNVVSNTHRGTKWE